MRTAFLSDIHGNLDALVAVLKDAKKQSIDEYFCLGDIVGYYCEPKECIELVKEVTKHEPKNKGIVIGNHDLMSSDGGSRIPYTDLNPEARISIILTSAILGDDEKKFLLSLPYTVTKHDYHAVHGSMHDPKNFNYVLGFDDAKSCFENMKKDIAFIGHSHRPEVWIHGMNDPLQACKNTVYLDYKRRYIVNAGSVGQPRDRNSNACYVIYDSDKQTVEFRRVNYNVMRFVEKMLEFEYHGEKFPAKNAVRLNLGG